MSGTTEGGQPTGVPAPAASAGNMVSPVSRAKVQLWETEDFLAAEPYPLPAVTEDALKRFIEVAQGATPMGREYFAWRPAIRVVRSRADPWRLQLPATVQPARSFRPVHDLSLHYSGQAVL
jgi:hypothetical protein